ncbi:MAG: hypothetical protein H6839_10620 [Planctomycetes bacterium]|nr:hypothetical protein [Planctomycetota bacterium]
MKIITALMMALTLALSAPAFAQETKKEETPSKEGETVKDDAEGKDVKKREMTAEGKSLYEDVERVYKKYYELVLAKVKSNEQYKADDVWAEAVKEAKNAKYKDMAEFSDAIVKMKQKDREFKKQVNSLMDDSAKKFAEDVKEWSKDQKK